MTFLPEVNQILLNIFGENVETRFRPSYFPFTEPSAEVDILSEDGMWLEILGCGIVNPVVLENCNRMVIILCEELL